MAEFHFVDDYEKHVQDLIRVHPIDEAMSLAIGGNFEFFGKIERDIVIYFGVDKNSQILDLGCGSGRLAIALAKDLPALDYIGFDVVQALLDYAKTKCPPNYNFVLNRTLTLPVDDSSLDFICAFSVFTHLLHSETFIYLEEALRCLRPGGKMIFSFLEFAVDQHWGVFNETVNAQKSSSGPHLNTFIEQSAITCWANRLGFVVEGLFDGSRPIAPGVAAIGQSTAVLRKPAE